MNKLLDMAGLSYFVKRLKASYRRDLTAATAGQALDATQGKVLEEKKLNKTDVVNDLVTAVEGKALDATQGKALFDWCNDAFKGRTLSPTLLLTCNWNSGTVTVEGSDRYHVFLLTIGGWRPAIAIKGPRPDIGNLFVFSAFAADTALDLTSYYITHVGTAWTISAYGGKTLRMDVASSIKITAMGTEPITHVYGLL